MTQQRNLRPLDPIFSPGKRLGAIAVGNTPASTGAVEHIEFGWTGLVDHLDLSMPHPVDIGGSFTELAVAFTTPAVIEFNVLVNGSNVGVVTTAASGNLQLFVSTITVVHDDLVQLELVDFGTGLAEGVGVVFRNPA